MNILLVSPLGFPIRPETTYAGIEQLVFNYVKELVKTHSVTVMGHANSVFPEGVTNLPTLPQYNDISQGELQQYQVYQSYLRNFDVIHDFSHQHLASRYNSKLPSLNIFWHAPGLYKYEKAPYNIIALSNWAAREFKRIYHQKALFQQSIALDTDLYKINPHLHLHRTDRFLTIGRNAPEKGNLNAVLLCKELGVPLDVIAARGQEKGDSPLDDYEKAVIENCDGQQIKFLGDAPQQVKIRLMQTCKALIYYTDHPEVTSHKIQETILCGATVIVPYLGALPEIVTQGVNGFLCRDRNDFIQNMKKIDSLVYPEEAYKEFQKKYSIEFVISEYIPLYNRVAQGEHW